ncbi:hypothetical protein PS685_04540 [Pseudomonas fluorescens]|uniref:Uncharacterized protein n=1 Tax=Pseudomonas fluorescens TaxID=294 RepID=A0A5E6ZF42_PSEFL|nr:hypothetical protein PS685_04540 [Pseudomonas fluorescens]
MAGEQLQEQFAPQANRRRTWRQYFKIRVVQSGFLQSAAITLTAQQRALIELGADIGQMSAATGDQVPGSCFTGLQL